MPHLNPKSRYHVRPGLRSILKDAHVYGIAFYETAGISHATYQTICKGTPFVSGAVRQKVIAGVVITCSEKYRARAEALWDKIPKAEVRVNGDKQVQTRLRDLARKHGLTPFEFLAELLKGPRDPLLVLNSYQTRSPRGT